MEELKKGLEKIDTKLDKVDERLNSIDVTLVKQNADLEHHIYRTSIAEKRLDILQSQVEPLSKFQERVNTVFRIVGIVCTGIGMIIGAAKVVVSLL